MDGVVDMSPLALTRDQAATLCGLSPTGFDVWVRKGIVPGPVPGTRRWSRAALEKALGAPQSSVNNDADEAFRQWEQAQHA